ncbi:NAD(P)-dependent oxidoreductase [Priestia megaterium]|uniref:NAD-dependent epimerase/dehydratase family protein n=1 Tax=Priestia megaterium TaxID=1404 RepID=UPI00273160E3|nr:NAD(P)-dependent oxidoreductase [Priestia megaterium]MDP1383241.1 NAD(P)-dependent oxidoreductase [Priestia megaterium]MDP1427387.1 NAD(P)-dependent oxidoreductase [Priestia megaterium]
MNPKNILVTGIGGFLGQHLSNYLYKKGFNIIGLGRINIKMPHAIKLYNLSLPNQKLTDILNEHKPDALIHCAGTSSVNNSVMHPYEDFKKNVEVCGFVLESIRNSSPKCKFIYLSSAAVYGNPTSLPINENAICQPISPYGYHKLLCEMLVEEYSNLFNVDSAVLRIFSAYGEGLRKQVIYDLCRKLTSDTESIEVYGNGSESRDFIHTVDICRAVELVINKDIKGTFNLASGEEISISMLIEGLKEFLKSTKHIKYIGKVRSGDPENWRADVTKLRLNGFKPQISFEQGLKGYCKWYLGGTHNE